MSRAGKFEQMRGDSSEIAVDEAVKFLGKHKGGVKPMFAVVWYGTPHRPFKALDADKAAFGGLNEASANHYGDGGLPGITPETVGGLRGNKGSVFEGGIRVPGIIEWPAAIKPRITSYPACVMDLFPTVADVVGLPDSVMVKPLDGLSLKPLFTRELGERRAPIGFRASAHWWTTVTSCSRPTWATAILNFTTSWPTPRSRATSARRSPRCSRG